VAVTGLSRAGKTIWQPIFSDTMKTGLSRAGKTVFLTSLLNHLPDAESQPMEEGIALAGEEQEFPGRTAETLAAAEGAQGNEESRGFRPLILGGAVLVALFLTALLRATAVPLIEAIGAQWLLAGLAGVEIALTMAFIVLVGTFVFREVSAYLRLSSVRSLRDHARGLSSPMPQGERDRFRQRLESYLNDLRERWPDTYREQMGEVERRMSDWEDPEEWGEALETFLLRDMDEEVQRVILQEAVGVGTTTALSPRGLIDVGIVLWRNAYRSAVHWVISSRCGSVVYVNLPGMYLLPGGA
jgi:uncharacterized membrane protein YcjF (UPF0283 family)